MKVSGSLAVIINRIRHKIEDNQKEPKYLQTIRGMGYTICTMIENSIIFYATLKFIITSLLLIVSFIFLLSHENFKKNEQIFERYKPIIKMVSGKKFYFDKDFHKNLLDMNYELFESKEEIKNILSNNKKMIFARSNKHNETFKIFEIDGKIYLFLKNLILKF